MICSIHARLGGMSEFPLVPEVTADQGLGSSSRKTATRGPPNPGFAPVDLLDRPRRRERGAWAGS